MMQAMRVALSKRHRAPHLQGPHPEIAAALQALASARGLTVEDYLEQLVEKELPVKPEDGSGSEGSGMVWENGLFVYRTGRPLPLRVVDDAIRTALYSCTK
jgi:hypothetical protein